MVYLIDVRIDYNAIDAGRLHDLLSAEWEKTTQMYESGRLIGIWRKANAKGAVAIWNLPDLDAVYEQIRAMPLYPWMSEIEVTPLVAHPRYPEFCVARERKPA